MASQAGRVAVRLVYLAALAYFPAALAARALSSSHGICKLDDKSLGLSFSGDFNASTSLPEGRCHVWKLPSTTVQGEHGPDGPDKYLVFELWRVDSNRRVVLDNGDSMPRLFVVVSRGVVPNVDERSTPRGFVVNKGTWVDASAINYERPYHRIVVPANATSGDDPDWYLSVAYLGRPDNVAGPPSLILLDGYKLRVSYTDMTKLAAPEQLPCPRPDPAKGECFDRGTCTAGATPLVRYCKCSPGWGDYGCSAEVTPLVNGVEVSQAGLPKGAWKHFSLDTSVTLNGNASAPTGGMRRKLELLVEMKRIGGVYAGDPLLFVKPADAEDRGLPALKADDMARYTDRISWFLLQSHQAVMLLDIGDPAEATLKANTTYYISIHSVALRDFNVIQRLMAPKPEPGKLNFIPGIAGDNANVTLRAAYLDVSNAKDFKCPRNCNAPNGKCVMPPPVAPRPGEDTPICQCNPGWSGLTCDGPLVMVNISRSTPSYQVAEVPVGTNLYLQLQPVANRFSVGRDSTVIDFKEANTAASTERLWLGWAIHKQRLPEESGWDWLVKQANNELVTKAFDGNGHLPIGPSAWLSVDAYYFSIFNPPQYNTLPARISVEAYVPSNGYANFLHPYINVVFGVTASLMLCMVLMLCRRLVHRSRFSPWGRADPAANIMIELQMGQVPRPRGPRGVPAGVMEGFPTRRFDPSAPTSKPPPPAPGALVPAAAEAPPSVKAAGTPTEALAGAPEANAQAGGEAELPAAGADAVPPAGAATQAAVGQGKEAGEAGEELQCTICLCEYEPGDEIRTLPCHHEFHLDCVDQWMRQHITCPVCRYQLCSEEEADAAAARAAGQGGEGGETAHVQRIAYLTLPEAMRAYNFQIEVPDGGRRRSRNSRSRRRGGGGGGPAVGEAQQVVTIPIAAVQAAAAAGAGAGNGGVADAAGGPAPQPGAALLRSASSDERSTPIPSTHPRASPQLSPPGSAGRSSFASGAPEDLRTSVTSTSRVMLAESLDVGPQPQLPNQTLAHHHHGSGSLESTTAAGWPYSPSLPGSPQNGAATHRTSAA